MDKFRSKVRFLGGAAFQKPVTIKASSASNQFAGRLAIAAGSLTGTVSTSVVKSNDFFSMATIATGGFTSNNSASPLCVRSISEGNFFTLGFCGGQALGYAVDVAWEIRRIG